MYTARPPGVMPGTTAYWPANLRPWLVLSAPPLSVTDTTSQQGWGGGGGLGGGGKGVGDGGEAGPQQTSLQVAENLLFSFRHNFAQRRFFCVSPVHLFLTLFRSNLVHVVLLLSSAQFVGGGSMPRARASSGSIVAVASLATSVVVGGALASAQLSTLSAASSRHLKSGTWIICVDHVWVQTICRGLGSTVRSRVLIRASGLGQTRSDRPGLGQARPLQALGGGTSG